MTWIAFAAFSHLLSVGLYATGRSTNAGLNGTLALLFDFVSLALSAYIVVLLLGEGSYLFAVVAAAFFFGVPILAIGQRQEPRTQTASGGSRAAHVAELRRGAMEHAARTVMAFYGEVLVDKASTRREVFDGSPVCTGAQILTPAAESQLERAFQTSNPGRFACELAVARGAHRGAFGTVPLRHCLPFCGGRVRALVERMSLSDDRESIVYRDGDNAGFELELGPPNTIDGRRRWLISRFTGSAFS